jgi:hypothetical protein
MCASRPYTTAPLEDLSHRYMRVQTATVRLDISSRNFLYQFACCASRVLYDAIPFSRPIEVEWKRQICTLEAPILRVLCGLTRWQPVPKFNSVLIYLAPIQTIYMYIIYDLLCACELLSQSMYRELEYTTMA